MFFTAILLQSRNPKVDSSAEISLSLSLSQTHTHTLIHSQTLSWDYPELVTAVSQRRKLGEMQNNMGTKNLSSSHRMNSPAI
jgi:hypothetical protein